MKTLIVYLTALIVGLSTGCSEKQPPSSPASTETSSKQPAATIRPVPTIKPVQRQATALGKWDGVNGVRWGEKASSEHGLRLNDLASSNNVKVYSLTEHSTQIGGVPGRTVDMWFYNNEFFHCTMVVDRENLANCRNALVALYGVPKEHVIEGHLQLKWDSDNVSVSMVYYRDGGQVLGGDVVWEYKPIAGRCFPAGQ